MKLKLFLLNLLGIGALAQGVPSSPRSVEAIERVKPLLQKEFIAKGLRWGNPVFIRIIKGKSNLECWVKKHNQFVHFKTYKVCYFSFRCIASHLK